MRFTSGSDRRSICEIASEIEAGTLGLLSLFVFVLLTTLVAMLNVISIDQLFTVLFELNLDARSFAADTDGDSLRHRGIFPAESDEGIIIPKLNRLAFIVVVGQIVNRANQKITDYCKLISLVGLVLYSLFLLFLQGEDYVLAWILSGQFLVLAVYCLVVGVILVSQILPYKWSSFENRDSSHDEEKRPRIRTSDD